MDVCVDLQARSLGRAPGVADGASCLVCVCHGRLLWVVAASPPSYPSTEFSNLLFLGQNQAPFVFKLANLQPKLSK